MPNTAAKVLPLLICYGCGDPLREDDERGSYRGTEMHRLCAIETRLSNIEDALGVDSERVDAVNRRELH